MDFDNIQKTNINCNRIIKNPKYVLAVPNNLNISDIVVVYNDGRLWKIVPLDTALSHPIIYDKYYENDGNIVSDISITYCPYTSCAITYFGKYKLTNKVYNSNIILENNKNYMVQMLGVLYSKYNKIIPSIIRREEVKIMTLLNALTRYPDCLFLHYTVKMNPLVNKEYLTNDKIMYRINKLSDRFHPKTLLYGIEYINNIKKYSAIMGDGANKNKHNSRDYNKNKFNIYFVKMMDEIRERHGIVYPVYWFAWYAMFPNTRVIKI